jgi:hypothetical protein
MAVARTESHRCPHRPPPPRHQTLASARTGRRPILPPLCDNNPPSSAIKAANHGIKAPFLKDGRSRKDQQHERQARRDRDNYLIAIYTRSGKGTDYKAICICRQVKALLFSTPSF